MSCTSELTLRILRDIDDSVLALDGNGRIIYMNAQCQSLLDLGNNVFGRTYADVFFDEKESTNDAFHQFIVDAIFEKEQTHKGTVEFTHREKGKMYLQITSSFLKNEDPQELGGVVLVMSDVTETEMLKKKRYDAGIVFSCTVGSICLYLLLLAALEFLRLDVPTKALTQVINGIVFVFGIIAYKKTGLTFEELGLTIQNPKGTLLSSLGISVLTVVLLITVKLVVLKVSPTFFAVDAPFWNWNIGLYSWCSYIFTCITQEFLARSMVYGSIKKMFDGKYSAIYAILLSALLFGAVHIAHGFMYMMTAMVMLGALGGLYEKHRNIWGVTMIHFILGQTACCLGFLS